jgi:hypothetical protein
MTAFPQALANGIYRTAARATAKMLLRDEIVRGVYVHRSVAAGEVAFGRSDIDLMIILREPNLETGDAGELASLYSRVCRLRLLNPAAGHIRMYTAAEFEASMSNDSYRCSVTRRNSRLLAGKGAVIPELPLRREDAIRRFAYWPDNFLSSAIRERNARSLRKIAADMWCSYAVTQGRIQEPYITRREMEERSRDDADGAGLADVTRNPELASSYVLRLAKKLHDEFLPKLKPLTQTLVFERPVLPRSQHRVVVVVPDERSAIPAEAFQPQSFFASPELLHLFVHYVNPFFDWILPDELRQLGFVPPDQKSYLRACRFFGGAAATREPGFLHKGTWVPGAAAAMFGYAIEHLKNGATPPALPMGTLQALGEHVPAVSEYYANEFASIYRKAKERSRVLATLL